MLNIERSSSDFIRVCYVFIVYNERDFIADILNSDIKCHIPNRMLSSFIQYLCFVYISIIVDLYIRVHFTEDVGIPNQNGFNDRQSEPSLQFNGVFTSFVELFLNFDIFLNTVANFPLRIGQSVKFINLEVKPIYVFIVHVIFFLTNPFKFLTTDESSRPTFVDLQWRSETAFYLKVVISM